MRTESRRAPRCTKGESCRSGPFPCCPARRLVAEGGGARERGRVSSQVRSVKAAAEPQSSGPARPPASGMPDSAACALKVLAEARQCGVPPPPGVLASCVRSLARTKEPPAGILAPRGTPVARGRLLAAVPLGDSARAHARELAIWTELGQWHKSARSYASAVEVWGLACRAAQEPHGRNLSLCREPGPVREPGALGLGLDPRGRGGARDHRGLGSGSTEAGGARRRQVQVQGHGRPGASSSVPVPFPRRAGRAQVRDLAQWARSEAGRGDVAGGPGPQPTSSSASWGGFILWGLRSRRGCAACQMPSSSPASSACGSARSWWASMPWATRPSWRGRSRKRRLCRAAALAGTARKVCTEKGTRKACIELVDRKCHRGPDQIWRVCVCSLQGASPRCISSGSRRWMPLSRPPALRGVYSP